MQKLANYASLRCHLVKFAVPYHDKAVCAISKQTGSPFPRKSGTNKQTDEYYCIDYYIKTMVSKWIILMETMRVQKKLFLDF